MIIRGFTLLILLFFLAMGSGGWINIFRNNEKGTVFVTEFMTP